MKEPPGLGRDAARHHAGPVRAEVSAIVAESDVVAGFRDGARARTQPVRMDVLPAKREDVECGLREGGASRPAFRDEDVAAPFVVEDPADVTVREVLEIEVPLVREAPDSLAGVVKPSRASLPGAPLRVDVLTRCGGLRCDHRRRGRLLVGARRRERHQAQEDSGLDAPHHSFQYGSFALFGPSREERSR